MFNVFAKRKLEKERLHLQHELMKMVTSKDAHWFSHYEIVLGELRGKFPAQIPDVRALCCVVAGGIAGLMALPENIADESKIAGLVQFIERHSIPNDTARWALHCWATALSALPRSQRQALVNEIKTLDARARQAEAERKKQQVASQERARQQAEEEEVKAELRRMDAAKQRQQREAEAGKKEAQSRSEAAKQEKVRAEAEKQLRAERAAEEKIRVAEEKERVRVATEEKRVRDNKNRYQVQRWRLAFPQQAAAIEEVAELASQALERASLVKAEAQEKAQLDVIDVANAAKAAELAQDNARIWELQQICDAARKSGDREWHKTYMEIERIKDKGQEPESESERRDRITASETLGYSSTSRYESREVKQKKREVKEKADEDAKRKRIAQEKATSVNRIAKEKEAQVASLIDDEILRRISDAPDPVALENQLAAAWTIELKRREEEKTRSKIKSHREQFPMQVAGFSDEEVLEQIEGNKAVIPASKPRDDEKRVPKTADANSTGADAEILELFDAVSQDLSDSPKLGSSFEWAEDFSPFDEQESQQPKVAAPVAKTSVSEIAEATALNDQARDIMNDTGDVKAAISIAQGVAQRFGNSKVDELRFQGVRALRNQVYFYYVTGQMQQGADLLENILRRYGQDNAMQRWVLEAMSVQSGIFCEQGETEEALNSGRKIIERFSKSRDPEVRKPLALSMAAQTGYIAGRGLIDSAQSLLGQMIELFSDDQTPEIRSELARAFYNCAIAVVSDTSSVMYTANSKSGFYKQQAFGDVIKAARFLDEAERLLKGNRAELAQKYRDSVAQARAAIPAPDDPSLSRMM